MRHVFFLLLVGLSCAAASAQCRLAVEVALDEPVLAGTLRLALCADARAYDTEQGCQLAQATVASPIVGTTFADIPEGRYAIKVFHDVNNNGKIDTNWLGIPTEPYGFSNDAMGTFGPPCFADAAFKVAGANTIIRIRMKG